MAEQNSAILFSARRRPMEIAGEGINFQFDILTQENHSWKLKVTTHPVEEGAPITDHVRKELRKGNLVGLISNYGLKRGALTSNVPQTIFDLFENYRDNAVEVNIATTLKFYAGYIINRVDAVRTGETGEAQSFTVSFQEFRTVKLRETDGVTEINIPSEELSVDADAQQASPNADVGEQVGEDPYATSSGKLERFVNFTDFGAGAY